MLPRLLEVIKFVCCSSEGGVNNDAVCTFELLDPRLE